MPLPEFDAEGYLPAGIHATTLAQALARFGVGSAVRQRQAELLRQVVEAAKNYPTIKRILVWGSFVTAKPEPNDLDYSAVVGVNYQSDEIAVAHRRFFTPFNARLYYGVDRSYLILYDYPLIRYTRHIDFICNSREKKDCGIVEISIWGENLGEGT